MTEAFGDEVDRSVLENSPLILEACCVGENPYDIINNVALSYLEIGAEIAERVVSSAVSGKNSIACRMGCSHCCHLSSSAQTGKNAKVVGMTLLDGVVLLEHMVKIRHSEIAAKIAKNMENVWRQMPTTLERLLCPFDDDGNCAVYSARPLVCRRHCNCAEAAANPA